MKNIFRRIAQKLYLELALHVGSRAAIWQKRTQFLVNNKAYLESFALLANKKLKYCVDAAILASRKILNLSAYPGGRDVDETDVEILVHALTEKEDIKIIASGFYLLEAYKYRLFNVIELGKDERDSALDKARAIYSEAQELSDADYSALKKKIKRELKDTKKQIGRRSRERRDAERANRITPIRVKVSHLIAVLSISSALFLISGFIYSSFLLGHFGVRVSDFFSISDYIEASTQVILPSIISALILIGAMLFGLSETLDRRIHEEQFGVKRGKDSLDWVMQVLPYFLIFNVGFWYYKTGVINWGNLFLLAMIILFILIPRLGVWTHMDNPVPVIMTVLVLIYFFGHIGLRVKADIEKIETGNYKPGYTVIFNNDYEEFSEYPFAMSTSTQIFLYDRAKEQIIAVPRSSAKYIRTESEPNLGAKDTD